MRGLLTLILAAGMMVFAAGESSRDASASGVTAMISLYHAPGTSSNNAVLTCGWHDNCLGGADGAATDWVAANGSWNVFVRLWAVGGGTTDTWVARASTYREEYPCNRLTTDVARISDWGLYGSIRQVHAWKTPTSTIQWNIYARTAGRYNAASVGYMIPHDDDNCDSTGEHVHQYYETGPYDNSYGKNVGPPPAAIPTRANCNGCNESYGIWTTHEYYFQITT